MAKEVPSCWFLKTLSIEPARGFELANSALQISALPKETNSAAFKRLI